MIAVETLEATPIGPFTVAVRGETVGATFFDKPGSDPIAWLERRHPDESFERRAARSKAAALLVAYFTDPDTDFSELELEMHGTEFELRVWRALREIPCRETASYGWVARRVGEPEAAQAVGRANGANPIPVIVPCHRVIGMDGSLTGFGGGLERKVWLLDHEQGGRLL
jgi:methylated-DNA-[protein]-cysteine S-methyltransferase